MTVRDNLKPQLKYVSLCIQVRNVGIPIREASFRRILCVLAKNKEFGGPVRVQILALLLLTLVTSWQVLET